MTGNLQHCHHFPARRQFVSKKKHKMLPKLHLIEGIVYGGEFPIQIF